MDQILATGDVVTVVHFTHGGEVTGDWRIACMPNMTEFHATPYHPNYQRTNDARAASCLACKRTPEYKRAVQALESALRGPINARS